MIQLERAYDAESGCKAWTLILVYSSHDTEHNSAVALREFLQHHLHGKKSS